MRVSTDPTDTAYIDDRPRRAWCNDVLIAGWTVADEFRRCVITPAEVHSGSVHIERLPAAEVDAPVPVADAPVPASLSGMFESDKPAPAVVEPVKMAPAKPAAKHKLRR